MFRCISALLLLVFISGCTPTGSEVNIKDQSEWAIPEGLKDCKMYYLHSANGINVIVVRCPKSSTTTTYSCGKNCTSNVTTDSE